MNYSEDKLIYQKDWLIFIINGLNLIDFLKERKEGCQAWLTWHFFPRLFWWRKNISKKNISTFLHLKCKDSESYGSTVQYSTVQPPPIRSVYKLGSLRCFYWRIKFDSNAQISSHFRSITQHLALYSPHPSWLMTFLIRVQYSTVLYSTLQYSTVQLP